MIGFKIREVMSGYHRFSGSWDDNFGTEPYFMEFDITWGPKNIKTWLNPSDKNFMKQPLDGYITIDGLCRNCPCDGTLTLAYHKGEICYEIGFILNGQLYTYVGKKTNIRPWNLPISHTTCNGTTILRTSWGDRVVSNSTLFFNFSTLPDFLKSFRLTNG